MANQKTTYFIEAIAKLKVDSSEVKSELAKINKLIGASSNFSSPRSPRAVSSQAEILAGLTRVSRDPSLTASAKRAAARIKKEYFDAIGESLGTPISIAQRRSFTQAIQRGQAPLAALQGIGVAPVAKQVSSFRDERGRFISAQEYQRQSDLRQRLISQNKRPNRPANYDAASLAFLGDQDLRGIQASGGRGGGRRGGDGLASRLFDPSGAAGRFTNLAQYSIIGGGIFGLASAISASFTEARELEVQFVRIEQQMAALGETTGKVSAEQFPAFREELLNISKATGVAATDLAALAPRFIGAFEDTGVATQALDLAAKVSRLTGLAAKEVTDNFAAISSSFGTPGENQANFDLLRGFEDLAIGLEERLGVPFAEIQTSVGDLAPVADAASLSLEETAVLLAVVGKQSGRSATAISEAFGRILPALQNSFVQIVSIANAVSPEFGKRITSLFTAGDTGQVLIELARNYNQFSKGQQDQILQLLGGRREAFALAPLFNDPELLNRELLFAQGGRDQGALAKRFEAVQDTLDQQLRELTETLKLLGVAILDAGLIDILKILINALELLGKGLAPLAGIMSDFNDALVNIPIAAATAIGSIYLLNKALLASGQAGLAGRAGSALGAVGFGGAGGARAAYSARTAAGGSPIFGGLAAGSAFLGPGLAVGGAVLSVAAAIDTIRKAGSTETRLANQAPIQAAISQATDDRLRQLLENPSLATGGTSGTRFLGVDFGNFATQNRVGRFISRSQDPDEIIKDLTERELARRSVSSELSVLEGGGLNFLNSLGAKELDQLAKIYDFDVPGRQAKGLDPGSSGGSAIRIGGKDYAATGENAFKALQAAVANPELPGSAARIKSAVELLQASEEFQSQVYTALDESGSSQAILDLSQIESGAKDGSLTANQALQLLTQVKKGIGKIDASAPAEVLGQYKQLQDLEKELISKAVLEGQEFANYINDITGDGSVESQIGNALQAFRDPRITETDRVELAYQIVELERNAIKERMDAATTTAEKLAIANEGIVLPEDVSRVLAFLSFRNQASSDQIVGILNSIGAASSSAIAQIVLAATSIEDLRAKLIDALFKARDGISKLTRGQQADAKRYEKQGGALPEEKQADAFINEILNGFKVGPLAGTDAKTKADLNRQAAEEAKKAQEEARQKAQDLIDSQFDFYSAFYENNNLATAQLAQQRAAELLRRAQEAGDQAAANRAAAEKIRADRQAIEAVLELIDSQIAIVAAIQEINGNTVGVAQQELSRLRNRLAKAQELGLGEAEVNNLKAEIIRQENNVRDATISDAEKFVDTGLALERLTTSQAIAYLERLRQIPELTQDQLDRIDLKIKELRSTISDLQYNLPTSLNLPTLYEVRRLNQSGTYQAGRLGSGGGIMSSNVVNVTMYVNNGMDEQAAMNFISSATNTNRFGMAVKRY